MLAIVVGLLLTVVVALGIVVLVAVPNLRQGSHILSPGGKRAVKRARQQAKRKPVAAVGGTWHGLVALQRLVTRAGRRIAIAWAPVSAVLHEAMDRLESKPTTDENAFAASAPFVEATPSVDVVPPVDSTPSVDVTPPADLTPSVDVISSAGSASRSESPRSAAVNAAPRPESAPRSTSMPRLEPAARVGRPRSTPANSGPIPEITEEHLAITPAERAAAARAVAGERTTEPAGERAADLRADEWDDDRETAGAGGSAHRAR